MPPLPLSSQQPPPLAFTCRPLPYYLPRCILPHRPASFFSVNVLLLYFFSARLSVSLRHLVRATVQSHRLLHLLNTSQSQDSPPPPDQIPLFLLPVPPAPTTRYSSLSWRWRNLVSWTGEGWTDCLSERVRLHIGRRFSSFPRRLKKSTSTKVSCLAG